MEDSQGNKALIEQMLRDAQKAEIPSELKEHPVIHEGDAEFPAPMTVQQLKDAGYVYIWDTRTFERSPCLTYMLPSKLRMKREDGSYVFTTVPPTQKPMRGTIKCLLHSDNSNRKHYDEMGLPICKKSNLRNEFEMKQHMKKRHPREWEAIENERITAEKERERLMQETLIKSVSKANKRK